MEKCTKIFIHQDFDLFELLIGIHNDITMKTIGILTLDIGCIYYNNIVDHIIIQINMMIVILWNWICHCKKNDIIANYDFNCKVNLNQYKMGGFWTSILTLQMGHRFRLLLWLVVNCFRHSKWKIWNLLHFSWIIFFWLISDLRLY